MDRLRAMEVFVKIIETGSLSGAAAQLHLANASVTTALRQLETRLGTILLQRTTRHIRITEEGADYYERCKAILAQTTEADAAVSGARLVLRGELHVEMPIAFGQLVLGPAMDNFAAQHPELRVIATLTNDVNNLIKRGIDVAVRMDEVETGELVVRPLFQSPHVLCAAPAFLARHGKPAHPREINPKRCMAFLSPPAGSPRDWVFRRANETHTVTPEGNLFFNSTEALMQTAARGTALIYVLDLLAERFCARGELVPLLDDWETDEQIFYAVYPKTRFTPAKVRAFIDFLLASMPASNRQSTQPIRIRRG
ncbi:LysR family transcriptional regulator [Acidisoma cellulosilytica]|uniref:LysR family transcriptional regulator n=1 Tax=Acidisoma cellulosilyticum TaxID=2802395 RepID=A0A964E5K8_9PROT|nr:LysR family transcriptional regulator [Acidisoma cellulosilyticum]MCB8882631.1 LysR family transcriptional regulator [Acidisoma cellulosilyticum]